MSAGSAGAFNCYIDRDIDRLMKRTGHRPLVTGELTDGQALRFAWILGVASTLWFLAFTGWLAAALSVCAILLYVFLYSVLLKRRTPQNIVWGGVAGCMPVLIGWAAVRGSLALTPFVLFFIIFFWTPPHYWPLSMRYREDYERAAVPMLGAVRGSSHVGLQIVLYTWATVACSLLLVPVAGMGLVYLTVAVAAGLWFLFEAHRLYAGSLGSRLTASPMRVFHTSIAYLTILFVAVAVDPFIRF